MEKLIHSVLLLWRLVFVKWTWNILRKAGTGAQKIQDLIHELHLHDEKIGVWCAMSARREISTISELKLERINKVFRRYADYIRSAGQYYQHLLDFQNVITRITAIFFLAFFGNCQTSRTSTNDVTLSERQAGAYRSRWRRRGGKKTMTLYSWY